MGRHVKAESYTKQDQYHLTEESLRRKLESMCHGQLLQWKARGIVHWRPCGAGTHWAIPNALLEEFISSWESQGTALLICHFRESWSGTSTRKWTVQAVKQRLMAPVSKLGYEISWLLFIYQKINYNFAATFYSESPYPYRCSVSHIFFLFLFCPTYWSHNDISAPKE